MTRCRVCGAPLEGRRRDALTCSAGCRREASRIRAVMAGRGDGPYSTLRDLAERRRSRAKRPERRYAPTSTPPDAAAYSESPAAQRLAVIETSDSFDAHGKPALAVG